MRVLRVAHETFHTPRHTAVSIVQSKTGDPTTGRPFLIPAAARLRSLLLDRPLGQLALQRTPMHVQCARRC